jgi:hypothetical protein
LVARILSTASRAAAGASARSEEHFAAAVRRVPMPPVIAIEAPAATPHPRAQLPRPS